MADNTSTTKVQHVADAEFATTIKQNPNVVVDCYADWCAPCKMIAPFIEALADEYSGRVTFVKLDVDNNPQTAMQYRIQGIPTLLFFKNGKHVDSQVGALPKPALKKRVDDFLAA
ncbi:MAG TPA: thioredoxin [bacterium]|jgi:thioredoxin 1